MVLIGYLSCATIVLKSTENVLKCIYMLNNQVFTPQEAAVYLKINPRVLESYLRKDVIPARKVGRQWRISKLALDLWLAPSLLMILPKLAAWQEIFAIGDTLAKKKIISDEQIIKTVEDIRKKRGLTISNRS